MPIDIEMKQAIEDAAADLKQPPSVARILIAWMEDASSRELPHADHLGHLVNLREKVESDKDKL